MRDDDFGVRLSMVDLAVNKVLAAASRREPRDLLDLRMVATIVPLWNAICAAPGKDASLTPTRTLAMIRRNAQYTRREIEEAALLPEGADASAFAAKVRRLLDQASETLRRLPRGGEGALIVDERGTPLRHPPDAGRIWSRREPLPGPVWPTGPDVDGAVISRLVKKFGTRGSKLWAGAEGEPDGDHAAT